MNSSDIQGIEALVNTVTNNIRTNPAYSTSSLSGIARAVTGTAGSDALGGLVKDLAVNGGTDFSAVLSEEASKLTAESKETLINQRFPKENTELVQMQELIKSLDKSILGAKSVEDMDTAAVAGELLEDGKADEVIGALVNGHLNGIALSDSEDLEKDTEESLDPANALSDDTADTLAQNLETILAGIGQNAI